MTNHLLINAVFAMLGACPREATVPDSEHALHHSSVTRTMVTMRIDSVEIGEKGYDVDIRHSQRIGYQTDLVALNDTLSLKVFVFDIELDGTSKLMYSWMLYKKSVRDWHELSSYVLYALTPGMYMNGWQGIGTRGSPDAVFFKCTVTFD